MVKGNNEKIQEPWEAKIYETDENDNSSNKSRVSRRKKKGNNSLFIKLCIALIMIMVAIPFILWKMTIGSNETQTANVKTSKVVKKKAKNSSKRSSSSSTEPSTTTSSTETPKEEANQANYAANNNNSATQNQNVPRGNVNSGNETPANAQYIQVNNGEGLQQVAARAGITAERLAQLNGITIAEDGYFYPAINPGENLRIK